MSTEFRAWVNLVTNRMLIADSGAPEGVIDAAQNALYLDKDTNNVYVKTIDELNNDSTQGWALVTGASTGGSWGSITGTLSDQTDLQTALDGKVDNAQVLTNVPAGAVFTDTTYVSSDFVHDDLTGFVANEHIDWTISGVEDVNVDRIPDLSGLYAPNGNYAVTDANNNFTANQAVSRAGNAQVWVDSTDNSASGFNWRANAIIAWYAYKTGDVAKNWRLDRFNDAGTNLGTAIEIDRATGNATFENDVTASGNITGANLNIANWNAAFGWGDHALEGYYNSGNFVAGTDYQAPLSNVAFTNVNNTFATNQSISGILSATRVRAGNGSGEVALTVNDGFGNANLTFNHTAGLPDANGSAYRLVTNADSTTAGWTFQMADSVTAGVSPTMTTVMSGNISQITSNVNHNFNAGIDVIGNITVTGAVDGRDIAADGAVLDSLSSSNTMAGFYQTGNYTINRTAAHQVVEMRSASNLTLTIGNVTRTQGDTIKVMKSRKSGQLTITGAVTMVVPDQTNSTTHTIADGVSMVVTLMYTGSVWTITVSG